MMNISGNLGQRLRRLERALGSDAAGRECEWAQRVSEALHALLQSLRRHAAEADSQDGPLTEVDQTRPTLARQVTELRRQHADLLAQTVELCRQVRSARQTFGPADCSDLPAPALPSAIPDFGALRKQANQLLAGVRRHEERETDLVQESVTTDIGVGD